MGQSVVRLFLDWGRRGGGVCLFFVVVVLVKETIQDYNIRNILIAEIHVFL